MYAWRLSRLSPGLVDRGERYDWWSRNHVDKRANSSLIRATALYHYNQNGFLRIHLYITASLPKTKFWIDHHLMAIFFPSASGVLIVCIILTIQQNTHVNTITVIKKQHQIATITIKTKTALGTLWTEQGFFTPYENLCVPQWRFENRPCVIIIILYIHIKHHKVYMHLWSSRKNLLLCWIIRRNREYCSLLNSLRGTIDNY